MYLVSRLAVASSIAVISALACKAAWGATAPSEQPSATSEPARIAPAHPFLFFDRSQTRELALRKDADPLLTACWEKLTSRATAPDDLERWTGQLEARALLWQLQGDEEMASGAIRLMLQVLEKEDPVAFYKRADFHHQARPLRALALAWDWLYGKLTAQQRTEMLLALEAWCGAAYEYTNQQWWREASYNVGAIPVSGIGLLATAIRPDSTDPRTETWYAEAVRRIGQNFFPLSWKESGICWEGPNYAIVGLRYAAQFAEALRRSGGPDLLDGSGALRAMQYQMYQWMPQGGCAPIGDNTNYGRRTFAAEYLLCMQRSHDAAGLWTWRTYTDDRRLDSLITFLWYPLELTPVSPLEANLPASHYFEVTPNRAGYVFSRSRWEDPNAAFFAFVTRFEKCNHQHYDMNSFLLGGFGTLFATHADLYPYGHLNHGVDFEHNMVVVDGGGWPAHDNQHSCGDDNSTLGVLVGLALGEFADYVRGDAKWSYRDNTILNDNPAIRAERACLFVKQGPTPYLLAVDDLQYSHDPHRYDWHWHSPDLPIDGSGTLEDPLLITAEKAVCAIRFVTPRQPAITIEPAESGQRRYRDKLKRIAATQNDIRVRYAAVATLAASADGQARVHDLDLQCANPTAGAVRVELPDGSVDYVVWQSEEHHMQLGSPLTAGPLQTDGLLAMVRVQDGQVVGYVLGEGTHLRWQDRPLVGSEASVCVSAGRDGVRVFGRRRAREGLPPIEPIGVQAWRPGASQAPVGHAPGSR